jgi:hypothetical protein
VEVYCVSLFPQTHRKLQYDTRSLVWEWPSTALSTFLKSRDRFTVKLIKVKLLGPTLARAPSLDLGRGLSNALEML